MTKSARVSAPELNLLILEDNSDDAALLESELRRTGYELSVLRAASREAYVEALSDEVDVVLADYSLPQFDAPAALELLQARGLDAPFIIVSGVISEETAVDAMRAGASDYLLKDRLARLGPAVAAALEKRDARRTVDRERRRHRRELETLVENSPDMILRFDRDKSLQFVNAAAETYLGRFREELLGNHPADLDLTDAIETRWIDTLDGSLQSGRETSFEFSLQTPVGLRHYDAQVVPERSADGSFPTILVVARDVTRSRHEQRRLEESEERWRRLVDRHPDGIVVIVDKKFVYANPAAAELHGVPNVKCLVGREWYDFVSADEYVDVERHMGQLLCGDEDVIPHVFGLISADGVRRDVQVHAIPMRFAGKDAIQSVLHDVTDQREYERSLIEARRRAEDVGRLKSAILTNMSHEIRTPLSSVVGTAALLHDHVDADGKELLSMVVESGDRLMTTLESVLELSRLESGDREIAHEYVALDELLEDTIYAFRPLAERKNLDLRLHLLDQSIRILIDPDVVSNVIRHLVHNAVKFTDCGRIEVQARVATECLNITVTDTGVGIDPAFLPQLFDDFEQESKGLCRRYEGNGLGLAIVKRLIDLSDGGISVTSTLGEGSTFEVQLPVGVPVERRQAC